jgi:2-iminoacetate synthase ThiH
MLVEKIRRKLAPEKISSEQYLEIHQIAHSLGLRSNITMLFGHIETGNDIITHLCRVRSLQDQTHGINTFIPLKYHLENNALGRKVSPISHERLLRIYAVSRLMLDNIPNIKVLWNYTGIEEALEVLQFGANDLASTALEEKVITMAGGIKVAMNSHMMESLIMSAGRIPQKTHSGISYSKDWPEHSPLHSHPS